VLHQRLFRQDLRRCVCSFAEYLESGGEEVWLVCPESGGYCGLQNKAEPSLLWKLLALKLFLLVF
jgi:hypothetical protein